MSEAQPETLRGIRNRALLLLGFAGALRRSELAVLTVDDLERTSDGFVLTLKRSKTDQVGEGRIIGIPYGTHPSRCPVRAIDAWLAEAAITEGPLFRAIDRHGNVGEAAISDRAVALVIKEAALAVGEDPDRFSGHSLRAGLATSSAEAGVPEHIIQDQTGHTSSTMLRRYIRRGSLFRENAAKAVL